MDETCVILQRAAYQDPARHRGACKRHVLKLNVKCLRIPRVPVFLFGCSQDTFLRYASTLLYHPVRLPARHLSTQIICFRSEVKTWSYTYINIARDTDTGSITCIALLTVKYSQLRGVIKLNAIRDIISILRHVK